MINFEVFLLGMILVSMFTGLTTEAVKTVLTARNVQYNANVLSGIVSAALSVAVGVGYTVLSEIPFSYQTIVCIVALVFLSWLCAMVGYDKVIQVISQFKTTGKDR
jgi:hypothetical protein